MPMAAAMRRELITGDYIQADEIPVDVQLQTGRGKNHQSYLWLYGRPGGTVVFDFRLSLVKNVNHVVGLTFTLKRNVLYRDSC